MSDHRDISLVCLVTAWALTLGGCATAPPVEFYTLSAAIPAPPPAALRASGEVAIRVGPVVLPEFLERPHIVVRTTSNRIDVDEFHRWGGSLQEDFSRILAQNLSALMATNRVHVYASREQLEPTYRLAIDVQQFDGRLGEGVTLNAVWTFVDDHTTDVLLVRRFAFLAPAATPDYEGLVAAHSAALAALCRDIATEIGRVVAGRSRR
jgi:uncharacterized lipoprotein YmbA